VIANRHADLFTRAANAWSACFNSLCAASAKLKVWLIDIEVVYVAEDGSMSFHGLRMPCRPKARISALQPPPSAGPPRSVGKYATECLSSREGVFAALLRRGARGRWDRMRWTTRDRHCYVLCRMSLCPTGDRMLSLGEDSTDLRKATANTAAAHKKNQYSGRDSLGVCWPHGALSVA
jgi:hypothetical protein